MKRHSKSAVLDISIHEDQLEHDRIRLEHNLQHTDLSLHLSSHDDDTLEYPRHNNAPAAFPDFISFDHHDTSNFDPDTHSQLHAWSYRTADDDDAVSPYGGETVSTAAHHASALTLSAGLGGRGARREISLSGAEYDPDRSLHHIMAAVDPKLSMFDMDPSRSRYDPAAFDSFHSAGPLDRVLQSGHKPPSSRSRSVRIRSPHSSNTSSASSDSDSPRPRLADALQRVSFSPKRPRSPHAPHHPNHRHAQVPPSPLTRAIDDSNAPTPRPPRRSATPAAAPTPTSQSHSQFTRAARGLTRDLVEEQQQEQQPHDRNPFTDIANRVVDGGDATRRSSKSRVYLPDVTGLTSAVESPAKAGGGYNAYVADDRPRDSEARLLSTLSVVQTKLYQLEDENGISRRRVRELELELEVCKREVARERTRVLERSEASAIQREAADHRAAKGKAKARGGLSGVHEQEEEGEDVGERYREVVEEKKALESLIATLRTHLTRLTAELSSHQELLTELRKLRDRDARTLREKGAEVDRLRREVERLAGEVEVLRGVVEEGLRERALRRETSEEDMDVDVDVDAVQAPGDVGMSEDLETSEEEDAPQQQSESEGEEPPFDDRSLGDGSEEEDEDDDEDAEPFDPLSIMGSSRENVGALPPDRTMRTDHATRGSTPFDSNSNNSNSNVVPRRLSDDERARMAEEIEQRGANVSGGSGSFRSRASTPPPPPRRQHKQTQTQTSRRATVEDVSDEGTEVPRVASPPPRAGPSQLRRPAVPTPSRARGHNAHHADNHASNERNKSQNGDPETPFPQIRGAHLERLFFSAPEHDARTCTVCGRRRGGAGAGALEGRARARGREWVPSRMEREFRARMHEAGSDDDEVVETAAARRAGKQREREQDPEEERDYEAVARKAGLPPQTIVARVIRELEDDFTHYKSVYVELADQYKEMDAVSDVPKRNMLAKHLREVVDILEQKGDQIASLYDCLTFKDRPLKSVRRPS
ncbi:hypothetical protein B0H16DRAFT_1393382 [Mycena metata]|uniref:Cep57 centrosome microtubule-binding domain-containing protein n=1 Tax=Mycena metata TaxID=1033252 RepID=A0AAD7GX03_9AGAR|nr:hypothetical protein B0H16DRAFT_1393382 [Mycena metata]